MEVKNLKGYLRLQRFSKKSEGSYSGLLNLDQCQEEESPQNLAIKHQEFHLSKTAAGILGILLKDSHTDIWEELNCLIAG